MFVHNLQCNSHCNVNVDEPVNFHLELFSYNKFWHAYQPSSRRMQRTKKKMPNSRMKTASWYWTVKSFDATLKRWRTKSTTILPKSKVWRPQLRSKTTRLFLLQRASPPPKRTRSAFQCSKRRSIAGSFWTFLCGILSSILRLWTERKTAHVKVSHHNK